MAARSRARRNDAPAGDCYSRAVFKTSVFTTSWRKDLPEFFRLIAVGARSLKSFCSGRANWLGKSTEPIPGCAKDRASGIPVRQSCGENELQACSTIAAPLFSPGGTLRPYAIQHVPPRNCECGRFGGVFAR